MCKLFFRKKSRSEKKNIPKSKPNYIMPDANDSNNVCRSGTDSSQHPYFSHYWTPNFFNNTILGVLAFGNLALSILFHFLWGASIIQEVKVDDDTIPTERRERLRRRRVAIVTGSNAGIGFETAKTLVLDYDVNVILACRSRDKAIGAVLKINREAQAKQKASSSKDELQQEHDKAIACAIFCHPLDLTSFDSVREFAKHVSDQYDTVDILINNAGRGKGSSCSPKDDVSVDNLYGLFQTNYWSHFLLSCLLLKLFPKDGTGRIVTVSSVKHHFLDNPQLTDEQYWKWHKKYQHDGYGASKLAAILFTQEFNRRYYFNESNNNRNNLPRVRSFSVNPGAVNSNIFRNKSKLLKPIIRSIFLSCKQGCSTEVSAAVGSFDDNENTFYLQPYWIPEQKNDHSSTNKNDSPPAPPFPVFEMLGPYVGYRITYPRLPQTKKQQISAAQALWNVSEQITGCEYPQ